MTTRTALLFLAALAAACSNDEQPTEITPQAALGVTASATGGGYYLLPGDLPVQFSFSAVQQPNGHAAGSFHIALSDADFEYDIRGRVTCLTVDPALGRAWIGGVVTSNTSTDPAFQTPIHQPGRDVWFRVLDAGEGSGAAPDRATFYGFEGGGGIITSAEYCAAQIWPDGNARTWPVAAGNISVR